MRGDGASWVYAFPDGITERYTIQEIMSVDRLKDAVENAYVWSWGAKEYLKEVAKTQGKNPQYIEDLVNRTPELQVVVDVGNRMKHPDLRNSRSGLFPKLGQPSYVIRQAALQSLSFSAEGVVLTPSDPTGVDLSYPVLDQSNNIVGEATVLLGAAMGYWETVLSQLK